MSSLNCLALVPQRLLLILVVIHTAFKLFNSERTHIFNAY